MTFHKAMTLQEAKSIARHSDTLRLDGKETTAYYIDDFEGASPGPKPSRLSLTTTNKSLARSNKSAPGSGDRVI